MRLFEARALCKKSHLPVYEYLSSKLLVVEQIVCKFMCPFTLLEFHYIFLCTSSVVGYLLVLQTCRLKDPNTKQGFVFKSAGAMTPHPDKVHTYLLQVKNFEEVNHQMLSSSKLPYQCPGISYTSGIIML